MMVNIALGSTPVTACDAGDANHDGQITVDEIVTAENNALKRLWEDLSDSPATPVAWYCPALIPLTGAIIAASTHLRPWSASLEYAPGDC
ncbi:MAG: hypothetical protein ABSA52_07900 [Candidatus Binatia bacterium]|jgi:hypothetical protein